MPFVDRRIVNCSAKIIRLWLRGKCTNFSLIFLFLIGVHLKRFTYKEIAVSAEKRITALRPIFLRSSCSGSAAQERKVTTSFAIWLVVAGVPVIED